VSDFLNVDQILAWGERHGVSDPHVNGETSPCWYCGLPTKMASYTMDEKWWPSCCYRDDCVDKWEPAERPA
jgi:hypothetical protein